jgi:phenylpyruvate tautomerase PptA (4-oxalocrotonate tautomerase family)
MPLVRIDVRKGRTISERAAIGDAVHRAMVECFKVPEKDRFQVIAEHGAEGLIYEPAYLDIAKTNAVVFVQITFTQGRTVEQKKAFYARLAELLDGTVRREDFLISLVEVQKENWSFGNGVAQYAT